MRISKLIEIMPKLLASGVSIELVSAPGRGKSEVVRAMVPAMSEKMNTKWGLATCFLATMTPPDLLGVTFKGEREYTWSDGVTRKVTVSDPALPVWMLTEDGQPVHNYKHGILFLDEYGQGEADVKRASAELLLNKRLGPWSLPPGWTVIAASNRAKDRSGVTKSFDFVINRRMEIHIDDDVNGWETWALANGIDPFFIAFAMKNVAVVFSKDVPAVQGPWCTPRSFVMASKVLELFKGDKARIPANDETLEIAASLVGDAAAAQLMAFVKVSHELPDYRDIVNSPDTARVPAGPDGQMLIAYELGGRTSVDDVEPVVRYMKRLPKEFAASFIKTATARQRALILAPAFREWIKDNASLVALISR